MSEPRVAIDVLMSTGIEIPDKLYFRIGDVSRLAGIKPYVLRFWETEFPGLGPKKSGTGNRLYRPKDVEKFLEDRPRGAAAVKPGPKPVPAKAQAQATLFDNSADALAAVRKELTDILVLL